MIRVFEVSVRLICFCAMGMILYSIGADVFSWKYWAVMLLAVVIGVTT